VSFPERLLILSRLSASFIWLTALNGRQSQPPVLMHSSNLYPLGNCVSLRPETCLSYLTRFGTASYRPSPLSPFFAFTDDVRTSPEELAQIYPRISRSVDGAPTKKAGSHLRSLSLRTRVYYPNTRRHVRLLGPCYKTGHLESLSQRPKPGGKNIERVAARSCRGQQSCPQQAHYQRPSLPKRLAASLGPGHHLDQGL